MSKTAFEVAASQPWAIQAAALEQILAIASGYGEDPEALAARLGRPLQNAREVSMHGDGVAVIPIAGPIFHRANLFTQISGATSTEMLALDFTSALENPDVNAIVLDISSPGGQVAGISELAGMIAAGKEIKPVISYINSIGASGGYWLASAASSVVINNTAMTGSIGVVMSARADGKDDKRIEIVSSNAPKKRISASTDEGRAEIQSLVDRLEVEFIDAVANYRGVNPDFVKENFGAGGLVVGADAVGAGMADDVGTFESIIAGLSGSQPEGFIMPNAKPTGNQAPVITIDTIKAEYPEIATALRAEGEYPAIVSALGAEEHATAIAEATAAGALQERERIQSVHAQGAKLPGHDALIARLMFDGKTGGPEAAVEILAAESAVRGKTLQDIKEGAPPPAPAATPPAADTTEPEFWSLVEQEQAAGATRSESIKIVTAKYPQAHKKMLAQVNQGVAN